MILRPPDYESGATNQLSYGTFFLLLFGDFCVGLRILSRSLPLGNSLHRHLSALKSLKNKLRKSFKELIIFAPSGVKPDGSANIRIYFDLPQNKLVLGHNRKLVEFDFDLNTA